MAKKLAFDRIFFTAVMALVGLGLAMVYSASAVIDAGGGSVNRFVLKQAAAALCGLLAMTVAMNLDYRFWQRRWVVVLLVMGALALQTLTLFAPELNQAHRWLFVGGVSFQPSETARLVVVIYLAYQMARAAERERPAELLLPAALVAGALSLLVFAGRDFGGALLLVSVTGLMLFLAGLPWVHLSLSALGLAPAVAAAVLSEPYRRARLMAFLDPEIDPLGRGFQASQSLIAVGSGGLLGLGLGKGLQKLHFLPYPHSDFVYAVIGEELGLVGAAGVLALFAILLWRGVRAGLDAPDAFGRFLAWGLSFTLVVQALIHISVALTLLPTTGITLPFVSYGGSSLVACLFAAGVILNVSQHG